MRIASLLLLPLVAAADYMHILTTCDTQNNPCDSNGHLIGHNTMIMMIANEGCRDPPASALNWVCFDWGNKRMEFHFNGQAKRCMRKTRDVAIGETNNVGGVMRNGWISRWDESACNW